MLDKRKHIPLYIQLKEEIIEKIHDGIWQVDSQIPTEKALMEEYCIGRATVREAISLLVNEGYLYKKQGVGTFVARQQPSLGFEPLISLTYSLKARGINAKNIVSQKMVMEPDKRTASRLRMKSSKQCLYIKRIRYAENTPIAIEDSYFSENYKDTVAKFDMNNSLAKMILEDLKVSIKKVEQVITPRMPSKQEQDILKISESTLVLNMERWIYIETQKDPFYYLNFIIPGNIYSFSLY